jgi:hypothetical protein
MTSLIIYDGFFARLCTLLPVTRLATAGSGHLLVYTYKTVGRLQIRSPRWTASIGSDAEVR